MWTTTAVVKWNEAAECLGHSAASHHTLLLGGQPRMAKPQSTYPWKNNQRVHILVAELALGKPLPKGVEVHHVDGDKANNAPTNLVICQDQQYHMLLHVRQRVKAAGGDPNTQRMCADCKQPVDMVLFPPSRRRREGIGNQCRPCVASRIKRRYQERKPALSEQLCGCGCGSRTFVHRLTGQPSRFRSGHNPKR
jgi:hypothetical protein